MNDELKPFLNGRSHFAGKFEQWNVEDKMGRRYSLSTDPVDTYRYRLVLSEPGRPTLFTLEMNHQEIRLLRELLNQLPEGFV